MKNRVIGEMNMSSTKDEAARLKQVRDFGLLMTLVFTLITGALLWKGRSTSVYPLSVAGVFLLFSIFAPMALSPLERAWMAFAEKLSVVMTFLIVSIIFVFAVTPMGLFLKLLRKDLLSLRIEPERDSYWEPVEVDGPGTRYYTPY